MFRWAMLAILVSAIATSGYFRRRARIEGGVIARREEGPILVAARALVTLPLLGALLAYLIHPAWMTWASLRLPAWARLAGLAVGIACLPFLVWVLRSIGKNISETVLTKPGHELVTAGPYRWVRHPLYTTGLALLVAFGLMSATWVLLGFALLAALLIRTVVIPREETALLERFGDGYRQYMRVTGRMLPRIFAGR